jgi:hypothetical protein
MKNITDWNWGIENKHTLYGLLMNMINPIEIKRKQSLCIVSNNNYGKNYYEVNDLLRNTPFTDGVFIHAPCYIKLLENFESYMKLTPKALDNTKLSFYKNKHNMDYAIGMLIFDDDDDTRVELHFVDTLPKNINTAITKWELEKRRMKNYRSCLFKLCDNDDTLFSSEIGHRFIKLKYINKVMFLSNQNLKEFEEPSKKTHTMVFPTKTDKTPNGDDLEKLYKINFIN